jgi:hypothetical protein
MTNIAIVTGTKISTVVRRVGVVVTATLIVWPGCASRVLARQTVGQDRAAIETTLFRHGMPGHVGTETVIAWNEVAHDIAVAEDQFLTFKGQRALAMMHLAIHDAVNSIVPVYARYASTDPPSAAHPVVAAAQAAHDVLASQYPGERDRIARELARWLEPVPNGPLRDRGIALGHRAAAAILKVRAGDGWDVRGSYEFGTGPGVYQTTPPWNGFVAQPGFRFARPFALEHPQQFRPSPPPRLTSHAYAHALREVQLYGSIDSSNRTKDQTAYAIWWMEFAEGSVNRLARQLTDEHRLHLWEAARLFAHLGIALYDGYVAVWDSKYESNHWRPYTAIREAATDGNPRTTPDPGWEPLRPPPPFPEYASAHATACAASFGILARTFGEHQSFTMETTTAPADMPARSFASFRAAAEECADSRVRLGWHYRYATEAGLALGGNIAQHVARHTLRRMNRSEAGRFR